MEQNDKNLLKIFILLILSALLLICAILEGYSSCLAGYVIAFFVAVLAGCIVTALTISIAHLIGLIFFGFVIGFLTQAVGTNSDLWSYDRGFIFAAISWSLAAVTMEGISRIIRYKLTSLTDYPLNVVTIVALFGVLLVTLASQHQWMYANESFWIYYVSLAGFAILMQTQLPFTELLSLILAAWIMGSISEWLGAIAGLWHFRSEAVAFPPLFIVLGCWPLEFLIIRGLAAPMKGSATIK